MEENSIKKCESCGKTVPEHTLDRWGDCCACRAEERANDMCVGDLKDK
jgi:hypothetical protein